MASWAWGSTPRSDPPASRRARSRPSHRPRTPRSCVWSREAERRQARRRMVAVAGIAASVGALLGGTVVWAALAGRGPRRTRRPDRCAGGAGSALAERSPNRARRRSSRPPTAWWSVSMPEASPRARASTRCGCWTPTRRSWCRSVRCPAARSERSPSRRASWWRTSRSSTSPWSPTTGTRSFQRLAHARHPRGVTKGPPAPGVPGSAAPRVRSEVEGSQHPVDAVGDLLVALVDVGSDHARVAGVGIAVLQPHLLEPPASAGRPP